MAGEPSPETRGRRFLLVVLAILLLASAVVIWPFLTGTVFALVLGYLLHPAYRRLRRVVRWRPLAATMMIILVLAAIVGPLTYIVYRLAQDASTLAAAAQETGGFEAAAVNALGSLGVDPETARTYLDAALAAAVTAVRGLAQPALAAALGVLVNVAAFFFLLYFVFVDGEHFARFTREAMPLPRERREHLMETIGARVRALFLGTFFVSIVQGVAAGLGWWYFGFPAPVFWAFVMTVLAILPGGAPFLVLVPAGVLALLQGNTFAGVGILVYSTIVVGALDNLLRPFVVGRGSDVHPAIVFLGSLGGIAVFGATGFVLGPLLLSLVPPVLREMEHMRGGGPASDGTIQTEL